MYGLPPSTYEDALQFQKRSKNHQYFQHSKNCPVTIAKSKVRRSSAPAIFNNFENERKVYENAATINIRDAEFFQDQIFTLSYPVKRTENSTKLLSGSRNVFQTKNSKYKKFKCLHSLKVSIFDCIWYKLFLSIFFGSALTIVTLGLNEENSDFVKYVAIYTFAMFFPLLCILWNGLNHLHFKLQVLKYCPRGKAQSLSIYNINPLKSTLYSTHDDHENGISNDLEMGNNSNVDQRIKMDTNFRVQLIPIDEPKCNCKNLKSNKHSMKLESRLPGINE